MIRKPEKQIATISEKIKGVGKYTALGYRSASVANREGRSYTTSSGEMHIQYDRLNLVNQSREFMRDNAIYKGMIERAVSYIMGNGFGLQARTKNAKWNKEAELLFSEYWNKPEIRGLLVGSRVERIVARELLVAGDLGIIKTNKGLIQLIESEQITGTKYGEDGIEKDEFGKPLKYFVAGYSSNGGVKRSSIKPYTPKDFIFITDPERPSSLRSVPPCQSSFAMIHRINDICDSEALAWQLLARLALSITRKNGNQMGVVDSIEGDNPSSETDMRIQEMDYALIFHGEPGDEIKGVERNIPSQNFSETLTMFLRLLGLPLGMPLEIIMLDWTKSNYSQSRAVLEQAYQIFIGWQSLIENFFHREIYRWKIDSFITRGLLKDVPDKYKHEWIKPTFPWLDQLKEAEAQYLKVESGISTHSKACKSQYLEREDVVDVREFEIRDAITRAQNIKSETGVDVDWRLFAGLKPAVNSQSSDTNKKESVKQEDKSDDSK